MSDGDSGVICHREQPREVLSTALTAFLDSEVTVNVGIASWCHLAQFLLWLVGKAFPQKELLRPAGDCR